MVTVVRYGDDDGRNEPVYTPRYSGESEDPRSLTLETTAAFVLHSRARHLLVHGRLCLPARLLFSYHSSPLSLRFFALVLLHFTPIQEDTSGCPFGRWSSVSFPFTVPCRFTYRYHAFSRYCLTRAIFMQLFPSLSRTHLIYRAVRYDQQQFSSVRCWCAHCHTRYIETRSGHWLSPVREVERRRGGNEGDRAGSHAWCVIRPRKEGRQAGSQAGRRAKKKKIYVGYRSDRSSRFVGSCASTRDSMDVSGELAKDGLNLGATDETFGATYIRSSLYIGEV